MGLSCNHPPSLKDLILLELLNDGPICRGTMISSYGIEPYPSFSCNPFTAGSLSYVIVSLVALSYTEEHRLPTATGMFVGIGLMYTTGMALSLLMDAKA